MSQDPKGRAAAKVAPAVATALQAPATATQVASKGPLGNEFRKDQLASFDKQTVATLVALGVQPKVAEGVAQAMEVCSVNGWDPGLLLCQGPDGVKVAGIADEPGFTDPIVQAVLQDSNAIEYLKHTVALLSGQSVIGAHALEAITWWKAMGIRPDVADELGFALCEAAFASPVIQGLDESKRQPGAQATVSALIGSVPPGLL